MTSTLYQQIQQLYDASSGLWEQVWGEHMHHGYYGPDGNLKKEAPTGSDRFDRRTAGLGWSTVREGTL
jgi:hypothetical protein